jgi:diguanylate cyclase (GGDEF)-like protein
MYTYAQLEERAAAMLRYHSDHDALTNCLNRRTFNERLQQLEKAGGTGCGFLLMDIDHFKAINDRHGHLVGRVLDADSMLFRYGGEEFAAIIPDTDERSARRFAESLRAAVETGDFGDVAVTVSLGVAVWTPGQTSMSAVLDAADRALYAAKRGGRNRVVGSGDMTTEKLAV